MSETGNALDTSDPPSESVSVLRLNLRGHCKPAGRAGSPIGRLHGRGHIAPLKRINTKLVAQAYIGTIPVSRDKTLIS